MKTLVAKLAGVMALVGRVQKRGRNTGQNYNYATEADVAEEVRGLLSEAGLILIPSVKSLAWREIHGSKGPLHIATVMMDFTFTDGESSLTYSMVGEGMDSGDKNVYKAMTGAEKYALMKFFLIPTGDGDDPEKDDEKPVTRKTYKDTKEAPPKAPVAPGALSLDEDILWHADEIARLRGGHRDSYIEEASGFPGTNKKTGKPETVKFADPRAVKSEKWKNGTLEKLKDRLHKAGLAAEPGAAEAAELMTSPAPPTDEDLDFLRG